jgi:hypothetical protein
VGIPHGTGLGARLINTTMSSIDTNTVNLAVIVEVKKNNLVQRRTTKLEIEVVQYWFLKMWLH